MRIFIIIFAIVLGILSFPLYAEDAPANVFTLTTTAFLDEGAMPTLYTCDGKDISPQLDWTNPPAKTNTFAVIFSDKDAVGGGFYHWVVYNIPKSVVSLPEAMTEAPSGAMMGKNSWDKLKYNGPCPPKGTTHNYVFTLYALDAKLKIPAESDAKAVLDAMQGHIIGKPVELKTVYIRWNK